jgi:hemoglobin
MGLLDRFLKKNKTALYYRLGEETLDAAVDLLYRKVLDDPSISHFFEDVDIDRLRYRQKMFLTMALGGPNKYKGRDLTRAHARLLKWGLDDSHFDRLLDHTRVALRQCQVGEEDIEVAINNLEGLRDDVLARQKKKA